MSSLCSFLQVKIKQNKMAVVDYSFPDAIENQKLPIVLQSINDCILGDKTVLKKEQILTVLDRACIDLILCRDSNDKSFRLAKDMVLNFPVDYIEEFYPNNQQELEHTLAEATCVQTKGVYNDQFFPYGANQIFEFHSFLDKSTAVLSTKENARVCISAEVLLNPDLFVIIKVKETKRLQEFLDNFDSKQHIRVRDPTTNKAIVPNFFVDSVGKYEVVYTVTTINEGAQLKYETIPMDKRIIFRRVAEKAPLNVEVFGSYNTECYRSRMQEIKQLMNYELHSPRYYGCLIIENQYRTNLQRPNKLNLTGAGSGATGEKNNKVRDSLRRGFNMIKKRTPSREDLRIIGIEKPQQITPMKNPENSKGAKKVGEGSPKAQHLLGSRSSSDSSRQKTIKKTDINPLYDIDTLTLKKLKAERMKGNNETQTDGGTPSSRRRMLPRPKSLDFDHRMFYETPFREKSPHGTTRHVSNEQIFGHHRSPSMPIRVPHQQENRLPRKPLASALSLSSSPLGGGNSNILGNSFESKGQDSGVDSPEESRSFGQIMQRFNSAGVTESLREDTLRTRSQSAMDQRKPLSSSDLNISLPYNFKHIGGQSQNENLYAIPSGPALMSNNFSELDGSMNFPDLENMSLSHSNSDPALYDQSRLKSHGIDFKGHIYESVIYGEMKGKAISPTHLQNSTELKSMREIKKYTMAQIGEVLEHLGLSKHVNVFCRDMVNGHMLVEKLCENQELFMEMGLSKFEARKLYKYVHGWRPLKERTETSSPLRVEEMDREEWSVQDVCEQMARIKLVTFGGFCSEHFIDGALLLDLVKMDLLSSLCEEHQLELKNLEIARLESVVIDKLQYDDKDLEYMAMSDPAQSS